MDVTVYKTSTGQITARYSRETIDDIIPLISDDEGYVEGWYDFTSQYVDHDNEAVFDLPPSPGPSFVFDYEEWGWIDTYDAITELDLVRSQTSMTRTAFCVACARAGIISEDDAIGAAAGAIPPGFMPVFNAMSEEERFENRVRWAGAVTISRMDPIILACAEHIGMTPEALDSLFGIE
ncbi:hypothetical protein [Paracoccus sulfuroxidans]|uniref:Uncharacterized protein n=1 Tax=Paracoccus sulfuroxidans TaxID=384678 RepID=A0A562P1L9_9RHOB|nr:hypothetical protein [Paracoccus sulfuroxidans]TWI38223.1 hypothetical protein IQ24_00361 [Paracoccus sulfuroxidans]